jgi:hypothetical protein
MPFALFHLGRRNDSHNLRRSEGRMELCSRRCSGIRSRMDRSPLAAHLSITSIWIETMLTHPAIGRTAFWPAG